MRKRKTLRCNNCNSTYDVQPGKKASRTPCPCCGKQPNLTRNPKPWTHQYKDNHIPDSMTVQGNSGKLGNSLQCSETDPQTGNMQIRYKT